MSSRDTKKIEALELADREFLISLQRGPVTNWNRGIMEDLSRTGLAEVATVKLRTTGHPVDVARLTPRGRRALKAWFAAGDPWERRKRMNGADEREQKKNLSAALRRDK